MQDFLSHHHTADFDFHLPETLIAQHPAKTRTASRLLHLDGGNGALKDETFSNITQFFEAGDVLVLNDTKVIKARLFGQKLSGGKVEVMIERLQGHQQVLAQIKSSKAPKTSSVIILANDTHVEVVRRVDDMFLLQFSETVDIMHLLDNHGHLPLPPYISHQANAQDESRYQTVFAKYAGAVAAPTAGLHFDEAMLKQLEKKGVKIAYVTLHVGAGTFKPVKTDNIREHKMHSERYHVPAETIDIIHNAQRDGYKVTAVGTTVLRALESMALTSLVAGGGETSIFITPGFEFKIVNRLLTNFHLPKSTLLMLVSAFAGFDNIKRAYQHAIEAQYRFFSYGDAMLIERQQ